MSSDARSKDMGPRVRGELVDSFDEELEHEPGARDIARSALQRLGFPVAK